jgi:hypothetical protein
VTLGDLEALGQVALVEKLRNQCPVDTGLGANRDRHGVSFSGAVRDDRSY